MLKVGEDNPEVWHVQVISYLIMLNKYFDFLEAIIFSFTLK